jgi:hypothetical protein
MNERISFHSDRLSHCLEIDNAKPFRDGSKGIMIQSTANLSLLFLRALIFSAILIGPVVAFVTSYEGRNPSNGGIGLVLLVSLQRV